MIANLVWTVLFEVRIKQTFKTASVVHQDCYRDISQAFSELGDCCIRCLGHVRGGVSIPFDRETPSQAVLGISTALKDCSRAIRCYNREKLRSCASLNNNNL